MQPATDRAVVAKRSRAPVRRQHGFLDGVFGVLCGSASQPGEPVQPDPMTLVQLGERAAIAGEVGTEQVGVAANRVAGGTGHGSGH
jgi:hypothetical protein